ncbi:glycoside hydrolase domain-containing protein [Tenacibaculum ovolyticum]|uniref:glycoside hydrolase domain-containing protein n=1 Tax=Tenacibaculum ovolyticum TaxID=104270 RepID=UPI00040A3855|nr:glycoside hydrolase domain-containing protein [Tenacibaculum ovolyticum]
MRIYKKSPRIASNTFQNLKGFDTNTIISFAQAIHLKKTGYTFCIRYTSHTALKRPNDLSFIEAKNILNAGLSLSVIHRIRSPDWKPNTNSGIIDGQNIVRNAINIGLPLNMNIWCDLKGVSSDTSPQNLVAYCNAWYDTVFNTGYIPGLYIKEDCSFNSNKLYQNIKYKNLKFKNYWKPLSKESLITNHQYQLIQSLKHISK